MSNQSFDEKDEKNEKEEKEVDKREEKTVEEKWRRDPLASITWAVILIWAGLVLLADNMGWLQVVPLNNLLPEGFRVLNPGTWSIILGGAGVIILIEVVIRLLVPAYRAPIGGSLILAAILIGVFLGNVFGWELIWPLIVIAIGLSILLRGFWRRQQ